ncbi:hypothetical protein A0H81_06840 [Grifola frondosa]|uniref:Uncharacterized protein n=1 Tax=Grifola frondosa TaxID=5627 RepID=A0A1C7M922_GRIFR|nr:hypothetical protein A0H81_06840 [Grifola frondosa]
MAAFALQELVIHLQVLEFRLCADPICVFSYRRLRIPSAILIPGAGSCGSGRASVKAIATRDAPRRWRPKSDVLTGLITFEPRTLHTSDTKAPERPHNFPRFGKYTSAASIIMKCPMICHLFRPHECG